MKKTYLVELDLADIYAMRDAIDLADAYLRLRRAIDTFDGKPVRSRPGPLRRRLLNLQRNWPTFTPYPKPPLSDDDVQRLLEVPEIKALAEKTLDKLRAILAGEDPCYGIHNFITDPGGDDIDGPAHCTECGAERIDILFELPA